MCVYIYIYIYIHTRSLSLSIYIYIYIDICICSLFLIITNIMPWRSEALPWRTRVPSRRPRRRPLRFSDRWNRSPRPQPEKFSKLVFLI